MSFRDIALPLIKRGIPVIPVEPNLKKCLLPGWQGRASAIKSMVDFWDAENPDYNVGCVGKPYGIVVSSRLRCSEIGQAHRERDARQPQGYRITFQLRALAGFRLRSAK